MQVLIVSGNIFCEKHMAWENVEVKIGKEIILLIYECINTQLLSVSVDRVHSSGTILLTREI